jgi:NAD-dependent dihydropyrimidine dehydrogenase PreA subunit
MIKDIDELLCIDCGICENVCPTDVLREEDGRIRIAYPDDCCNCMDCLFFCPTDAIVFVQGVPDKFNLSVRWKRIKEELSPPG